MFSPPKLENRKIVEEVDLVRLIFLSDVDLFYVLVMTPPPHCNPVTQ